MIRTQCPSCTITLDMPCTEDEEGVLLVRCRYCGQEHEILMFDTTPPLVYSRGTNNEGAANAQQ